MDIAENLAHSREELFVIFFYGLRRTLFDKRDLVDYKIKARSDIILELSALDSTHGDESFECFCRNAENIGANLFFIFWLFRDSEDIIHSCKIGYFYIILDPAGLGKFFVSRKITFCERTVELDDSRFLARRVYLDITLDLAS